jgi:hypothetical protein
VVKGPLEGLQIEYSESAYSAEGYEAAVLGLCMVGGHEIFTELLFRGCILISTVHAVYREVLGLILERHILEGTNPR